MLYTQRKRLKTNDTIIDPPISLCFAFSINKATFSYPLPIKQMLFFDYASGEIRILDTLRRSISITLKRKPSASKLSPSFGK